MSLIRNLIKESELKTKPKAGEDNESDDKEKPAVRSIKSATDLQRFKLEKLMKNPDKPIDIPQRKYDPDYMKTVPDFVRNVMGSSAGAGSGEFHVYRHLRRKEYSRQKFIEAKSKREGLDQDYHDKLEDNKRKAEERTAKKRAKRQKKKGKKPRIQTEDKTANDKEAEEPSNDEQDEDDEESNANVEEIIETPANVKNKPTEESDKIEDKLSSQEKE